ncbi:hypothetical protein MBLNU230_g2624t1 [Neophaeotheca triangularis]
MSGANGNVRLPSPEVIASWPTPNYNDPVTRSWMPAFAVPWQVLVSVLVLTRLLLRWRKLAGPLGLDDALLIPAWLSSLAVTVAACLAAERYNSDRHLWDVPLQMYPKALRIAWIFQFVFLISTASTKVSILLFYRRLVKGSYDPKWLYAILGGIIIIVCYCLSFLLALLLACQPTKAYWLSADLFGWAANNDYKCADARAANLASGMVSVLTDAYAVILPMAMLKNFTAPRRQKIALYVLFSLGLLVVAAGCMRTYYLSQLGHVDDLTWQSFNLYLWSQLECQLALIVACVPATRALFRRYFQDTLTRVRSTLRSANTHGTNNTSTATPPPTHTPTHTDTHSSPKPARDSKTATVDIEASLDSDSQHAPTTGSSQRLVATPPGADGGSLESGVDRRTPTSTAHSPSHDVQIRSPSGYEEYNLAVLEKYRGGLGG